MCRESQNTLIVGGTGNLPQLARFWLHMNRKDSLIYNRTLMSWEEKMLGWALTFFIIAIIAALLGFTGVAGAASGIAQILFFLFLVFFVIALIARAVRGRGPM